jgi:hypothetical protein
MSVACCSPTSLSGPDVARARVKIWSSQPRLSPRLGWANAPALAIRLGQGCTSRIVAGSPNCLATNVACCLPERRDRARHEKHYKANSDESRRRFEAMKSMVAANQRASYLMLERRSFHDSCAKCGLNPGVLWPKRFLLRL